MLGGLVPALRRRIALKLTLTLVGFVGVALLAGGLYLESALRRFAVEGLEARLATAARLLREGAGDGLAPAAPAAAVHDFVLRAAEATGARVTLIAADGRVVGDSAVPPADLPRVENHADRPEVRAALAGGVGRDLRRSETVGAELLYVAVPVGDGEIRGVIRLAFPLAVVRRPHAALRRVMVAGGLVALAVALGLGVFVAGRITRPVVDMQAVAERMSGGDLEARAPVRSSDEIGRLALALNRLGRRLREKIDDLEQERARVAAILDTMVEGVLAVDGRDHVVLVNERARRLFGLGPGEGEGKPLLEVVRHADLHRILGAARRGGEGVVERGEITLGGPVERRLQVNAVPRRLGGEAAVVMVLHDVTELRRLEQVRTEFVANVSHELRTPLTAIQGYLETLLGGALEEPEHARRFLEIAVRHTERLSRLLSDLTDLSNIELGRVRLQRQALRVAEVVDSVLAILRARAEASGVALQSAVPADTPPVLADHDRLAQVLMNLVDNAVKYTPAGGVVTVGAGARGDGRIEIVVEDTGIGIPPADLPRVTERFYRVDRARSRERRGTGLGLAIVKHLVIAHDGTLTIESEPGRGTTVRVALPQA
jgi:two-component system phosphate regulon sensor histidine kinase PhoR